MKKAVSILLAALMLFALAACGTAAPAESAEPVQRADHYQHAWYYLEDGTLTTVDHYDARGHILGDEVYQNGELATYEEFRTTENFTFEIPELTDNADVVSTEYAELYVRSAEEGSEFRSSGMVFVFGYDAEDHMRMAKVFALNEEGTVLFSYVIYYQLDEHGNFTGWTHMTENGEVLFEMQAENVYDGDQLTQANYYYTRYGNIDYENGYQYQAQDETTGYTLSVVFEY